MGLYLNKLIFLIEMYSSRKHKTFTVCNIYTFPQSINIYLTHLCIYFCHMGFKVTVETMYMSLLFLEN